MKTIQFIHILSPEQLIERGLLKGFDKAVLEGILPSLRQHVGKKTPFYLRLKRIDS